MSIVSKNFTFSAGATIIASEHNDNFDTLYNDYNGNITNSNIASGAAIANSKLDLNSISQMIDSIDIDGGSIDGATIGANESAAITATTVTTGDITTDEVWTNTINVTSSFHLLTDSIGDIMVDNGTGFERLTPGTDGQFLKTQGASALPIWADSGGYNKVEVGTFSATSNGDVKIITATFGSTAGGHLAFTIIDGANDTYVPGFRFNEDGTTYASFVHGSNNGTAIDENSAVTTYVPVLGDTVTPGAGSTTFVTMDFIVQGTVTYFNWQATQPSSSSIINGSGTYDSTITSVNIHNASSNGSNETTGTYKLIQYSS